LSMNRREMPGKSLVGDEHIQVGCNR
jgi:hypothetical protein